MIEKIALTPDADAAIFRRATVGWAKCKDPSGWRGCEAIDDGCEVGFETAILGLSGPARTHNKGAIS
ncbi:hypothetical protein ACTTAI_00245 (plasmid) [Rhodobacter capsulatus]|uniref:hypothetical protein n=1 Tax=Rhodobacter capsulatus TaxID=1061 RepID=UPI0040288C92